MKLSMPQTKLLFLAMAIVTLVLLIWYGNRLIHSPRYLTVTTIRQNMEQLDGKRITVRGDSIFALERTKEGCDEDGNCQHFKLRGYLYLSDVQGGKLLISDLNCYSEDQRYIVCSPFDPYFEFEFVGVLRIHRSNNEISGLSLENIDLVESRRLINGNWTSIPTGEFVISLQTPP